MKPRKLELGDRNIIGKRVTEARLAQGMKQVELLGAHGFLLSWWRVVVKIVSEPFPPRVAGGFSDKLHWAGCLYLRG